MDTAECTEPLMTEVLASRAHEARARLAAANRRLDRAGITEAFTWDEEPDRVKTLDGTHVDIVRFYVNRPYICYSGWEFLAAVDVIEGGVLVNAVPGVATSDLERPDGHRCDHCRTDRYRKYTYLLRSVDTGEVVQVGKTCLELFLGVKPGALWTLRFEIGELEFDPSDRGSYGTADVVFDLRLVLRAAWLLSDFGKGFISRRVARERQIPATSDEVIDVLCLTPTPDRTVAQQRMQTLRYLEGATELDPAVDALIEAGRGVEGDYGQNLAAVLDTPWVALRHFALICSVISVVNRNREAEVKRERRVPSVGFLGDEGEKIHDILATVETIRYVPSAYGTATLLIMREVESGRIIKWFGSVPDEVNGTELEEGQTVIIVRATVKEHEQFGTDDQTRIVRGKLARPE